MINAVIELGSQRVHEVMVPAHRDGDPAGHGRPSTRPSTRSSRRATAGSRSTRTRIDEIVGILYAKDLLPFLKGSVEERPSVRSILRTPVFVPESMTVDDLLHELQRRKVHLAIVLDEYGGTAGLVTIEDLLEEIVGEIQDEYDEEEPMIVQLVRRRGAGRRAGRRSTTSRSSSTRRSGSRTRTSTTPIGGLIYHRIGGVPKPGDRVEVDGLTPDGRDDRRPARRQGPRGPRAARLRATTSPTARSSSRPPRPVAGALRR